MATELDSHVDSSVVGKYSKILDHSNRHVNVSGFTKSLGKSLRVPVVTATVIFDCEFTGTFHVLVIHNALYIKDMEVNLIPPMMMRLDGIKVNECPKFLSDQPSINDHCAYFPDHDIRISFLLEGIVSYIPTRKPSDKELKDAEGEYLLLTSNTQDWDPHTIVYRDQEYLMTDYNGHVKSNKSLKKNFISSLKMNFYRNEYEISDIYSSPTYFINAVSALPIHNCSQMKDLSSSSGEQIHCVNGISLTKRGIKIDERLMAKKLNIPLEMARKTILVTTQHAIRSGSNPSLTRKYKSNDKMLRYKRLNTVTFMDTMFATSKSMKSIRGNDTCQVFATEFGHIFVVPMKGKAGFTISRAIKRYFKEIGVPDKLICDQAREQLKGDSRILCNEPACTVVELEKGVPSSNRAERTIKILKDEVKRDMFVTNSPLLVFWDYAIECRATIINSTVRSNYLLNGQTPHLRLTKEPTDISSIIEYDWYEWVIYRKEGVQFPFQHQKIGRALGPSQNAGNTMAQWILTGNGEIMSIHTLRCMTDAEKNNPAMKDRMKEFDDYIQKRFGNSAHTGDEPNLESNGNNDIIYDELYESYDESENKSYNLAEMDEFPDHEIMMDAEVMLPKNGDLYQSARVIGRSKNASGNYIGNYHHNPVLNTQVYDVMFPDGAVIKTLCPR